MPYKPLGANQVDRRQGHSRPQLLHIYIQSVEDPQGRGNMCQRLPRALFHALEEIEDKVHLPQLASVPSEPRPGLGSVDDFPLYCSQLLVITMSYLAEVPQVVHGSPRLLTKMVRVATDIVH